MIGLEHTKIAEVVASEISKKELNGFNEIKAENSLGKDICDSFWSQLFNSKIGSILTFTVSPSFTFSASVFSKFLKSRLLISASWGIIFSRPFGP